MEAPEAPPIKWTTDEILNMLGINTQGARNGIQEEMLTELKGVGHLNYEDVEGIQSSCGGYAKGTLANGISIVMRVNLNISPQQNGKEHFTVSPQKNGNEYFTI